VNTIDGPTKLVSQEAILGGLSIGQLFKNYFFLDPCLSGQELSQESPIVCTSCPANQHRDRDIHMECVDCPTNHITLADAATSEDQCLRMCLFLIIKNVFGDNYFCGWVADY